MKLFKNKKLMEQKYKDAETYLYELKTLFNKNKHISIEYAHIEYDNNKIIIDFNVVFELKYKDYKKPTHVGKITIYFYKNDEVKILGHMVEGNMYDLIDLTMFPIIVDEKKLIPILSHTINSSIKDRLERMKFVVDISNDKQIIINSNDFSEEELKYILNKHKSLRYDK